MSIPGVEGIIDCLVSPRYNTDHNIKVRAWILPRVTNNMSSRQLSSSLKDTFSYLALADPFFTRSSLIALLLGANVFAQV